MAGDHFNGDEYCGIDEYAFGDGETDSTTQSLSAGLENAIDNDARNLRRRGYTCGRSIQIEKGNERKVTSLEWTCFDVLRWPVTRGDNRIEFPFLLSAFSGTGEAGSYDVDVKLDFTGLAQETQKTVSGDGTLQQFVIATDLVAPGRGTVTARIWVRGMDSGDQQTDINEDVDSFGRVLYAKAGTFLEDYTESDRYYGQGGALDPVAEAAYLPNRFGEPQPNTGVFVPVRFNDNEPAAGGAAASRALTYIQPLSWSVRIARDPDIAAGSWVPKNRFSMRANQQIRGQDTSRHAANVEALATEPRLKHWGPSGVKEPASTWPTGFSARWPRAYGDGGGQVLCDEGLKLDWAEGWVSVKCFYLPWHIVELYRASVASDVIEDVAFCEWAFTATLVQPQEDPKIGATTVGQKTKTQPMEHFPTPMGDMYPSLQQAKWSWFHQGSTGKDHYTFREGQLWDEDLALLRPLTFDFETSGVDPQKPARLLIQVEADIESAEFAVGETAERDVSRLGMFWIHQGLWESARL